jgi:hypothetical protein
LTRAFMSIPSVVLRDHDTILLSTWSFPAHAASSEAPWSIGTVPAASLLWLMEPSLEFGHERHARQPLLRGDFRRAGSRYK